MSGGRIRAAWWSILRDFVFPIAGLFGLYNIFTGHFTDLSIPIVGGICMALLGLPFWDRDDERRRELEEDDPRPDDDDPDHKPEPSQSRKKDADDNAFTFRIGLPGRRRRR